MPTYRNWRQIGGPVRLCSRRGLITQRRAYRPNSELPILALVAIRQFVVARTV